MSTYSSILNVFILKFELTVISSADHRLNGKRATQANSATDRRILKYPRLMLSVSYPYNNINTSLHY